jgi:nucleoside-diphosphate-sugar epimerase
MREECVLITGATGFIGSHVIERLLSCEEYGVVAIVRKSMNYKNADRLRSRGVILVDGMFYDGKILDETFRKFPVRYVIHLAAVRGAGRGKREECYKVNVSGTELLLEQSLTNRIQKFIFCSSVGVFGTIPKELPANLRTDLNGDNDYHHSKIIAERKVEEFIKKGLNAFVVRPAITYGRGDKGLPAGLVELVRRKMMFLPFKNTKIHLLDVNSLADLFVNILKCDRLRSRILIAADDEPIALRDLANLIHYHYYKRDYPSIFRIPNTLLDLGDLFFRLIGNEKWCARMKLLSKDWYYDTSECVDSIGFKPRNTKEEFCKLLRTTC